MICPVEIASDMSASRAVRMGDRAEDGSLSEGRDGAGDEGTGRDVAGDPRQGKPPSALARVLPDKLSKVRIPTSD
jgi:hypothetical protein